MPLLSHKLTLPILVMLSLFVSRFFVVFPQVDLFLSGLAHGPSGFLIQEAGLIELLRKVFWNLSLVMFVFAIIALAMGYTARWPHRLLPIRHWSVIFWGFLLAPGIIVNAILKAFSGRSRPINVEEFGGAQFFTAVGDWSGLCKGNCSFVSGEVSGTTAFCLAAVIFVQHHAARLGPKLCQSIYIALAAAFGFVMAHRILSGGHFTSDSLLSALYTGVIFALIAKFWPRTPPSVTLAD
jgi:lipid A 4'-phosphatase